MTGREHYEILRYISMIPSIDILPKPKFIKFIQDRYLVEHVYLPINLLKAPELDNLYSYYVTNERNMRINQILE